MLLLHSPKQNRILAQALPLQDYGRLFPYLEFTSMPQRHRCKLEIREKPPIIF